MFRELFEKQNLLQMVKNDLKFFGGKLVKPRFGFLGLSKDEFSELYGIGKADNIPTQEVLEYMEKTYNFNLIQINDKTVSGFIDDIAFMYNLEGKHPFIQYYIENPDYQSKQSVPQDLSKIGFR
jgi:hypothetical protein